MTRLFHYNYFLLILFTIILFGCEGKPMLYELSLSKAGAIFNFYPQRDTLVLRANYKWDLSGNPEWLKVSDIKGDGGEYKIALECLDNPNKVSRAAILQVSCGDKKREVQIFQKGSSQISLNFKDTIIYNNGTALIVGVNSPVDYDVIIPNYAADWVKIKSLATNFESGNVSFSLLPIADNGSQRKVAVAFVSKSSKYITDTLRITQTKESNINSIEVDKNIVELNYLGAEQVININAGGDWEAINIPEWISVTPSKGNSWTKQVSVSATKHTATQQRNGRFSIKCGNSGVDIIVSQHPYTQTWVDFNDIYLPDSKTIFAIKYKTDSEYFVEIPLNCNWLKVVQQDKTNSGTIIFEAIKRPDNIENRTATINIVTKDDISSPKPIKITQSHSYSQNYNLLESFYNSTKGDQWKNNSGWLTLDHYSKWIGIGVDANGNVTEISLPDNNLAGDFPSEVGSFIYLEILNLCKNSLVASFFPESLLSLKKLGNLNLSYNNMKFSFPYNIKELKALYSLDLSGLDLLESYITYSIRECVNLQKIYLENCNLTGPLTSEFFAPKKLTHISLKNNKLSGIFDLQFLPELIVFNIENNNLGMAIPPLLGLLPKLEELNLRNNCFIEGIPNTIIKKFGEQYVNVNIGNQRHPGNGEIITPQKNVFLPGDIIYDGDKKVGIIAYLIGKDALAISIEAKELIWSKENVLIGANDTQLGINNYNKYLQYITNNPDKSSLYPAFDWCSEYNRTYGAGWFIPTPIELSNFFTNEKLSTTLQAVNGMVLNAPLLSSHEFAINEYLATERVNITESRNLTRNKGEKRETLLFKVFSK